MTDASLPETQRERRGHDFYPPEGALPKLYATEGTPTPEKVVFAHYFVGSADWWLVEYDPEEGRAFGFANLGDPQNAEWGYVSLPELEAAKAGPGGWLVVERDLYWTPRPFADVWPPGRSSRRSSVAVYHNVAWEGDRPLGMIDGYAAEHVVSLVARLDLDGGDDLAVCDAVFRLLNVGDDPAFGEPDPVAVAYRARGNRSLSVGDVVAVEGRHYACGRVGWAPVPAPRVEPVAVYGTAPLDEEAGR